MHLPTHLVLSWLIGHRLEERRDRLLVAWAGVLPDMDSATALWGMEVYGRWHHVLTHGFVAAFACAGILAALAKDRLKVALLALAAFHLHLVCDLLGSGREWPIAYLYPFSDYEYFTPYGWNIAAWQNVAITAVAFVACAVIGVKLGRTFAEAWLPVSADAAIVRTLRSRFLRP